MGHLVRHTEFIKSKVRVWSNDSPGAEVNAFAHKIASESALLSLETRADALDGLATFVLLDGLASYLVVHEGADVVLQRLL